MESRNIVSLGKLLFLASFILGSVCLLGFIFTGSSDFAIVGYLTLICGAFINGITVLSIAVYAIIKPQYSKECIRAIIYMLINIPIAVLYAVIGLSIM